jgi:hypothetical protein
VGFNTAELACLVLAGAAASIIGQGLLLQPLVQCFQERGVISASLAALSTAALVSAVVVGLYPHKWLVFILAPFGILVCLSIPAASALASISISEQVCSTPLSDRESG